MFNLTVFVDFGTQRKWRPGKGRHDS